MESPAFPISQIHPFGLEARVVAGLGLCEVPAGIVRDWVAEHRLVVLRGIRSPSDDEMMQFCSRLGTILEWEFGAVNELKAKPDPKNYLYTNRAVPFHWDGAFAGKVPHYIFFHCEGASPAGSGGETLFCDTTKLLQRISADQLRQWKEIRITYSTEKVVHYGGRFTSPLLERHPASGQPIIRFAEPVEDLNPVQLEIHGLLPEQHEGFLGEMAQLLREPETCLVHAWRTGDIVIADNHALLHGRNAFTQTAERHLRRVNIL